MQVLAEFSGVVHYASGDTAFASRGRHLYMSADAGVSWQHFVSLPVTGSKRWFVRGRWLRRLARATIYHVWPIDDRVVVFGFGAIYSVDFASHDVVHVTPIVGSRPLCICEHRGALYYGEYASNPQRRPVSVWMSTDRGSSWRRAFTLTGVRHIHGVFSDPHEDGLWITTGDSDEESAIWVVPEGTTSPRRILGGGQQTRAVQLLFTKEFIYFGSDTPEEANYLYRFRRNGVGLEQLARVGESVFYGSQGGRHLLFATACEPSDVNRSREAVVWYSANGIQWNPLASFHKDRLSMKWFQYGQVLFAAGGASDEAIWVTPLATEYDQRSVKIQLP